jgi:hypothetical protein
VTSSLPLSEKFKSNEVLAQFASTDMGLKALSQTHGNFLVLDVHQVGQDLSVGIYFKLYDPITEQVYLAGHYNASAFSATLAPMLNSIADWAKKSKHH